MAKKPYICPVEEEFKPFCEKLYARVVKMAFRFCEPEVLEEVIQHAGEIVIRQWYWLCWCADPQIYVYVMKAVVHSHWRVWKQQLRLVLPQDDGALKNYPDDDTAEWATTAADFMQA